jgi:hypothetical protein
MATKWRRYLYYLFIFLGRFLYGVFVRFSTRGVQKHQKALWGKSMSKILAEKVEKKKPFPVVFSLRFC